MKNKETIIWDWNGTLLNDLHICVASINKLLTLRHLPTINEEYYRSVFTFPVKNYYQSVGFDFEMEPFEKPAKEFIQLYEEKLPLAQLFEEAIPALSYYQQANKKQVVLSAMEHSSLLGSLKSTNIISFFELVSGLDDIYAHGKKELGKQLIAQLNQPLKKLVLIGDTLHDKEVADYLGIDIVLVSKGHQNKQRLLASGAQVIDSLNQLKEVHF